MRPKPKPTPSEVEGWLAARHEGGVADLAPVAGGFWSSAFVYRAGGEDLVLRLGDSAEGFEIDAAAMRFAGPGLPVPQVIETGRALGLHYAISRRHRGRFIEQVPADDGKDVGRALETLFAALRAVPSAPGERVTWYEADASPSVTWHDWLLASLVDRPDAAVSGWRAKLAAAPRMDALFRHCEARIEELLPACPERRDLVHGDLLHQNVLVAEDDASRVTAVFSWKCSARGDFLYDVAWCTLWSPWHPGIAVADPWRRTLAADDLGEHDLADAPLRHHCYELQIAASHLGWYAWIDDDVEMAKLADVAEGILERGPLPA